MITLEEENLVLRAIAATRAHEAMCDARGKTDEEHMAKAKQYAYHRGLFIESLREVIDERVNAAIVAHGLGVYR